MNSLSQLRSGALAGAVRLDLQCGLTEFPREIFELADTLEVLNLTGNALEALPEDLGRLKKLRILFCSNNQFTELPPVLAQCPQLSMVGFKSNRIESVPGEALPKALRWLILTDNRLRSLPAELGGCGLLQKLMLSGNCLTKLPDEMAGCRSLELLRLAANELTVLPPWLLELPKLAWLALAGNPCATSRVARGVLPSIPWQQLQVEEILGEGASGTIYRALWRSGEEVARPAESLAVKVFKGAVTSDGLPSCEIEACLAAGVHPNLIPLKGRLSDHPDGALGLLMGVIDAAYATLAEPPNFETCTRDVYPERLGLAPAVALEMARGLAAASAHLHERGILHGDLYAHNVLWHLSGRVYLGDFGAASFYDRAGEPAEALERIEVRAFGCLMEELLEQTDWSLAESALELMLRSLHADCMSARVLDRPPFAEIVKRLG